MIGARPGPAGRDVPSRHPLPAIGPERLPSPAPPRPIGSNRTVSAPAELTPPDLRSFLATLPWLSADWDRTLSHDDRVAVELATVGHPAARVLVTGSQGAVEGVAAIAPLPWDSAHFGRSMATITLFRARSTAPERAPELARAVAGYADSAGFDHVRCVLDARDTAALLALQDQGWRVLWQQVRFVCDTTTVDPGPFPAGAGAAEVVDSRPEHLAPLLAIAARLPPYNWTELDPSLDEAPRRSYVATRLRNCFEAGFADVGITLLQDGQPVGYNGSALASHPRRDGPPTPFSLERDTFLDPACAGRGYGGLLKRAAIARLRDEVRYVTGKVRLGGIPMLRAVEPDRLFRSFGGELLLVRCAS